MKYLLLIVWMVQCSFLMAQEENQESEVIVLPVGTVYQGDYFACGKSIEISGTVLGDVYLLGEQIVIDGTVDGDVIACGGSLDISGNVTNNVRILAGQVLIHGKVGANVTALAGSLQLLSSAEIDGSVVAIAGNTDIAAHIHCDVTALSSNLRVSSEIDKSLKGYVGYMRITSRSKIRGNVDYRSHVPACIDQGAMIGGQLIHHPSFVHELIKGTWIQKLLVGSKVLALMMNFFYSSVVGIILIKLFPKNVEAALSSLSERPWFALAYGIVLLIALPLVSLILLMTILGIPFAITLIALNIVCLYTAKIYSIFWASNRAFKRFLKPNRFSTLCLGLLIYFCLTIIPVFGTILSLLTMLFGLGAGILAQAKRGLLQK